MDVDRRRAWICPPVSGSFDGVELGLLDPADEDDRRVLIRAEHPDLADAVDADVDEIAPDGAPMSPRLHLAMHELVASQLWRDDPPEVWLTAERIVAAGYERHEALHMLASVAAVEFWRMSSDRQPFNRARYAADLAALPESWEDDRDAEDGAADADGEEWELAESPDGTTFTHRVTEEEVAGGFVAFSPDLEPLGVLVADHGHLHLAGGEVAELDHREHTGAVLVGPTGWLGGARAGDLVGFQLQGDEVEVVPVTAEPAAPEGLAQGLAAAFDRLNGGDGLPVSVDELVGAALTDLALPKAGVLPPLGGLLADCGYEIRDGYAAPDGADWDGFGRVRAASAVARIHGLDPREAAALVAVTELYRIFAGGQPVLDDAHGAMVDELAALLSDPDLGPAFADLASAASENDVLARFADALLARAPRRHRTGPAWLASVAASGAGDHDRAESLRREALEADPAHWPSLEDAAWHASDTGDARRAVDLLARLADVGDAEAEARLKVLRRYAQPPRALARRNDPCPCGSGRKHKHCCLGTTGAVPLPERVRWIWEKLVWFLERSDFTGDVYEVADELGDDEPGGEALAASLVLFEDDVVEEFLRLRGPLLPDDERNLVTQWSLVDRSVHEVVDVAPGVGMTLRDVRTGDVVDVRERLGSGRMGRGDLLLAHVVPDGAGFQIIGGALTVPLRLRDPLLATLDAEADAFEVATLIGAASAPPTIVTTDGEPVVLCEARYRMSDAEGLAALDAVLDRVDDETWSDGLSPVRGMVAVEGDELAVSATSVGRFRGLRARVEAAVPGLVLLRESETPVDELVASRSQSSPHVADALPPEAREVLAAVIRDHEDRWVDEPVPALGGLTPHQAAADPTWREQLVALLREFDTYTTPPGAASFDTARLRHKLGLDG